MCGVMETDTWWDEMAEDWQPHALLVKSLAAMLGRKDSHPHHELGDGRKVVLSGRALRHEYCARSKWAWGSLALWIRVICTSKWKNGILHCHCHCQVDGNDLWLELSEEDNEDGKVAAGRGRAMQHSFYGGKQHKETTLLQSVWYQPCMHAWPNCFDALNMFLS